MSGAKRAPSSSVKNADRDAALGRRSSCVISVSSTSSPASTPRLPSKRPPVRTVSMCEPVITAGRLGSRPGRVANDVADRVDRARRARGRASTSRPGRGRRGRRRSAPAGRSPARRRARARRRSRRAPRSAPQSRSMSIRSVARRRPSSASEVEGGDLGQRLGEGVDGGLEQRRPVLGGGGASGRRCGRRGRSRSTASRSRPCRRSARSGWRRASRARCAWRSDMSTRSGARCSISDVSSVPPWIPMPSSSGADSAALVGRHAGVGEERLQPVRQPDLAVGHAQQRRVAAVAVEEHQLAGRRRGDAAADVVEHAQQRVGAEPDRAGRPGVLVRLRVGERRQQPHVELARRRGRPRPRPRARRSRGRC